MSRLSGSGGAGGLLAERNGTPGGADQDVDGGGAATARSHDERVDLEFGEPVAAGDDAWDSRTTASTAAGTSAGSAPRNPASSGHARGLRGIAQAAPG